MKYCLLSTALLFAFSQASIAHSDTPIKQAKNEQAASFQCAHLNSTNIDARYEVVRAEGAGKPTSTHEIQLIKNQQKVIYKRSPVTFEAWDRNGEYVRYFPQQHRSVTYRPSDLLSVNMSYDLEQQFHLVSPKLKSTLQQGENAKRSCFEVSQYRGEQAGQAITLEWIDTIAMPYLLTLDQGAQSTTYRLIQAETITNEQLSGLTLGYNDLDFADVGDSESDPFIAKMITQGFIQHGNTGFYDSNGNPLSDGHGSHSH